jgi:hypothetical protein
VGKTNIGKHSRLLQYGDSYRSKKEFKVMGLVPKNFLGVVVAVSQ